MTKGFTSSTTKVPVEDHGGYWCRCVDEHSALLASSREVLRDGVVAVVDRISRAMGSGGKLLLCGNGGSAADAQHIAAEFTVRFVGDRHALPAIALAADAPALTACSNDFGFEQVFSRQVEAFGAPNDVLIGISTSGRSRNVLAAFQAAGRIGIWRVLLTGKAGGGSSEADQVLCVPSDVTARIQEIHILIGHALVGAVERQMALRQ